VSGPALWVVTHTLHGTPGTGVWWGMGWQVVTTAGGEVHHGTAGMGGEWQVGSCVGR